MERKVLAESPKIKSNLWWKDSEKLQTGDKYTPEMIQKTTFGFQQTAQSSHIFFWASVKV